MEDGGSWMHQVRQPLACLTLHFWPVLQELLLCVPYFLQGNASEVLLWTEDWSARVRGTCCFAEWQSQLWIMCASRHAVSSPVKGVGVYCKGGKVLSHFVFGTEVVPGFSHPTPALASLGSHSFFSFPSPTSEFEWVSDISWTLVGRCWQKMNKMCPPAPRPLSWQSKRHIDKHTADCHSVWGAPLSSDKESSRRCLRKKGSKNPYAREAGKSPEMGLLNWVLKVE